MKTNVDRSHLVTTSTSERGQVLPLTALFLVVLLGIGALVADLGLSWMMRRHEQNAVDPAAVAAARYIRPAPNMTQMEQAACFYARRNGFFSDATSNDKSATGCVPANDEQGATLTVNYPPLGGLAGQFAGRPGFVQVTISAQHPSFFGRVFGRTVETVTTSAVAAHTDGNSNSNSLIALDDTDTCATGKISGTGTQISIVPVTDPATGDPFDGGYVYVNSTCGNPDSIQDPGVCQSGDGSGALKIDSNGADLTAPQVYVRGTCVKSNSNSFSSPLDEGAGYYADPLYGLGPPAIVGDGAFCGIGGPQTHPTGSGHTGCNFNSAGIVVVEPGIYYGGWRIANNVQIQLNPGIYIFAGGGISLQAGGSIDVVGGDPLAETARVMFFSTDNPNYSADCFGGGGASFECQGAMDFTAQSTFKAAGLLSGPYRGLLLWQDGDGSRPDKPVSLGGQTNLNIAGTIYAPKALVTLSGGSSGSGVAAVQIIAWQWTVTGGATLLMPYDPRELYRLEQKGLVH